MQGETMTPEKRAAVIVDRLGCETPTTLPALIAEAIRDAVAEEREACAKVADACAVRADRVEMINAFGVEAAQNTVKLAEGIASAIRSRANEREKTG